MSCLPSDSLLFDPPLPGKGREYSLLRNAVLFDPSLLKMIIFYLTQMEVFCLSLSGEDMASYLESQLGNYFFCRQKKGFIFETEKIRSFAYNTRKKFPTYFPGHKILYYRSEERSIERVFPFFSMGGDYSLCFMKVNRLFSLRPNLLLNSDLLKKAEENGIHIFSKKIPSLINFEYFFSSLNDAHLFSMEAGENGLKCGSLYFVDHVAALDVAVGFFSSHPTEKDGIFSRVKKFFKGSETIVFLRLLHLKEYHLLQEIKKKVHLSLVDEKCLAKFLSKEGDFSFEIEAIDFIDPLSLKFFLLFSENEVFEEWLLQGKKEDGVLSPYFRRGTISRYLKISGNEFYFYSYCHPKKDGYSEKMRRMKILMEMEVERKNYSLQPFSFSRRKCHLDFQIFLVLWSDYDEIFYRSSFFWGKVRGENEKAEMPKIIRLLRLWILFLASNEREREKKMSNSFFAAIIPEFFLYHFHTVFPVKNLISEVTEEEMMFVLQKKMKTKMKMIKDEKDENEERREILKWREKIIKEMALKYFCNDLYPPVYDIVSLFLETYFVDCLGDALTKLSEHPEVWKRVILGYQPKRKNVLLSQIKERDMAAEDPQIMEKIIKNLDLKNLDAEAEEAIISYLKHVSSFLQEEK